VRRRLVNAAALVAGAALLSACGTGLGAKTYTESGRADSGDATLGAIDIRNVHVDEAAAVAVNVIAVGSDATVSGVLVNSGPEDDALVSASSPVAASTRLKEGPADTATVPVPARGTSTTTWTIVLVGVNRELRAGQFISLTLQFKNAGHTTIQVPVRAANNGLDTRPEAQDPYRSAE
jgi:copper(I)-binding protein